MTNPTDHNPESRMRFLLPASLVGLGLAVTGVLVAPSIANAQEDTNPADGTETEEQQDGDRKGCKKGHRGAAAVAEVLGISQDELRAQLADGATVAEVAEANGVATQDLIDSLVAMAEERIDTAVEEGRLTEAEAAEKEDDLVEDITEKVNSEYEPRERGERGRRGDGPRGDRDEAPADGENVETSQA